jgi:hypothetical protein
MSTSTVLDPKTDRRRVINILGQNFNLYQSKTGKWYFERPLKTENGQIKKIAGVTHLAVRSPDKNKIKQFRNKGFKAEDGTALPMPDDEGKSIEQFVKLILRLKSGTDESGKHWKENEDFAKNNLFSTGEQVKKYLILADWAGLWDVSADRLGREGTEQQLFTAKSKSKKSKKYAQKRSGEFFDDPYIINWQEDNVAERKPDFHRQMASALEIMGLLPSELAMESGDWENLSNPDKKRQLKKLLLKLRYWSENPNALNPATAVGDAPKRIIKDGEGVDTGNRFHPEAKLKGVDPESIERFATDVNPIIEEEDYDGAKGTWKKGQTLVSDRNNTAMYNMVKVIRHFYEAQDHKIGKQPKFDSEAGMGESVLSQEAVGVGRYSDIKMSWQQIIDMRDCLLKGAESKQNIIKITREGKFVTTKTGTFDLSKMGSADIKKYPIKSYWDDAYFLFMLGSTALGGRAEELFDIIANRPLDDESSGIKINLEEKPPMYIVYVYTRKTEKMKDGKIHQAIIPNSDDGDIVKELIDDRQKDIKEKHGIMETIPPQYKGGKSRPNKLHSLIGADGKYTRIDTINLPTAKVKPSERRKIILMILRHCYEVAGLEDTFFYDRPIHSLRHVFAHYWLKKSGYDYNLVMKLGHWNNQKLLEGSYGKMDPAFLQNKIDLVAQVDPSRTHDEIAEDREILRKAKTKRERKYVRGKPKPSTEVLEVVEDINTIPKGGT